MTPSHDSSWPPQRWASRESACQAGAPGLNAWACILSSGFALSSFQTPVVSAPRSCISSQKDEQQQLGAAAWYQSRVRSFGFRTQKFGSGTKHLPDVIDNGLKFRTLSNPSIGISFGIDIHPSHLLICRAGSPCFLERPRQEDAECSKVERVRCCSSPSHS